MGGNKKKSRKKSMSQKEVRFSQGVTKEQKNHGKKLIYVTFAMIVVGLGVVLFVVKS